MGTAGAAWRALSLLLLFQFGLADRYLMQTVLDCAKVHPQCSSCVVSRSTANGLVQTSELVCKACKAPEYQVYSNGTSSTCACSPGYYSRPEAPTECEACPKNSWCPGGVTSAAQKNDCGTCLMTVTTLAQQAAACLTQPGCGYMLDTAGPAGMVCAIGTYSSGNNQQPCVPCPAGLTTVAARQESIASCMAPAGYFQQAMQALPCPKGTFKAGINRDGTCTPCPGPGITTAGVASASATACDRATPGYRPVRLQNASVNIIVGVEACPVGTFGPDGLRCIACTDNLTTQATASTNPAECLAAPGFGFYPKGEGDNRPVSTADLQAASTKVLKCPNGSYKAGWNLDACKSCGVNVLTDTNAFDGLALSADQCYLPPGWGASFDATAQQLVAYRCNNGTYGVATRIYGVEARPCTTCPANTVTPDQVSAEEAVPEPTAELQAAVTSNTVTSADQCTALPGYGWENGVSVPCELGYFAPGNDNQACVKCGEGLTTKAAMSRRTTDCVSLPGWSKASPYDTFAVPCPVGQYSPGAVESCSKCPLGSSTQYTASHMASQCSVCSPGWGYDLTISQCAICVPGEYSPGGSDGPCIACQAGQVSATGSTDSSDCFDEFTSIAPYDYISTPVSGWTVLLSDATFNHTVNAVECREACRTEPRCQYWLFKAGQDDNTNGCSLKLMPRNHAKDTYTAFKLGVGDYTIWEAADDEFEMRAGRVKPFASPDGSAADPWRCLRGCDKEASCRGVFITKVDLDWACWFVRGAFGLGSTASSIKAVPGQINTYFWLGTLRTDNVTQGAPDSINTSQNVSDPTDVTPAAGAVNVTSNSTSGPDTAPDEDSTTPFRPNGTLPQADRVPVNSTDDLHDPFGLIPHSSTGLDGGHSTYVPPSPPTSATDSATPPLVGGNGTAADPTSLPPVNQTLQSPDPEATSTNVIEPGVPPTTSINNAVSPTPELGPGYTEPYYLALAGNEKAFPDFKQPANQIKVAEALHSALGLAPAYNISNFKVWLASISNLPARSSRLLLQEPSRLLVLGFALAKQAGIPDAETLVEVVQNRTTAQQVAAKFAGAGLFVPEFSDSVAVGLVVAANVTEVIQKAQDVTEFAPIGFPVNQPQQSPELTTDTPATDKTDTQAPTNTDAAVVEPSLESPAPTNAAASSPAPATTNTPVVDESPAPTNAAPNAAASSPAPASTNTPVVDESPAPTNAAASSPAPASTNTPVVDESPAPTNATPNAAASSPAPASTNTPAVEESPAPTNAAPNAAASSPAPATTNTPVVAESPAPTNAAPNAAASSPAPAGTNSPVVEESPAPTNAAPNAAPNAAASSPAPATTNTPVVEESPAPTNAAPNAAATTNTPVVEESPAPTNAAPNAPTSTNTPGVEESPAPTDAAPNAAASTNTPVVEESPAPTNAAPNIPTSTNTPVVQESPAPTNAAPNTPTSSPAPAAINTPVVEESPAPTNAAPNAPTSTNTPVVEESPAPTNAAPNAASSPAPAAINTPVVEESPAPTNAAPNAASSPAPATTNTPVVEESPAPTNAAPNTPTSTNTPVVQESPAPTNAAPNTPTSSPAPAAINTPVVEESPAPTNAAPNAPTSTNTPVVEESPAPTNAAPNAASSPAPAAINTPVVEESPAPTNAAPNAASSPAPATTNTPVVEESPAPTNAAPNTPTSTNTPVVEESPALTNAAPNAASSPAPATTNTPVVETAAPTDNPVKLVDVVGNTTVSQGCTVTTVAGTGSDKSDLGDGQLATAAGLNYPIGVHWHQGSLYIADTLHHRIRRVDESGVISTFAGNGAEGFEGDGVPATAASLNMPTAISFGPDGIAYISDTTNARVRTVDANKTITTYAGDGTPAYAGDGKAATAASLFLPMQTAFDAAGNLYIADFNNHVVRMVNTSTGIISTIAGVGEAGFSGDGGPATKAALDFPAGMAFDAQGSLLIADMNNHVIRRVGTDGSISTVAGTPGSPGFSGDGTAATSAQLSSPADLSVDAEGGVIIADSDNHRIRRIDAAGVITTIAGSSAGFGGDGGPALQAKFDAPQGVALRPDGSIYVADAKNQRVRLLQCA